MENPVLIKWEGNWADEIQVFGCIILPKQIADSYKQYLESKVEEFELCIGTNEIIEYSNGQDLLQELTFHELTDSEFKVFRKYYSESTGYVFFGHTAFYHHSNFLQKNNIKQ